jgi:hypothetical protein
LDPSDRFLLFLHPQLSDFEMNKRVKDILWILSIAFFLLLLVQTQWQPIRLDRLALKNDPKKAQKPELTWENYKNDSFQILTENYLRENFAFREFGIRTYNQYCYSLWKKACNSFFFPGRDHWMYYSPGVFDYYGKEAPKFFESNEKLNEYVDHQVGMLNELRSILKEDFDIELLTFIAPDKAFVYPEHLPRMQRDTSMEHPAACFSRKFKEIGFPNIDMTTWFAHIADTSSKLLFMPMDTHWMFSAVYGYDSLFRLMDSLNDFGIPKMKIDRITSSPYKRRQDDEATLNLLFKVKNDTPAYHANISVEADSTSRKPRVLFVGDSFIFAFENLLPNMELISYYENWFYYDKVYKGFDKREYKISEINRLRSILNVDYVVVYSVGYQWCRGTDGFVEDALSSIKDSEKVEVALMMNEIEAKPYMMEMIKEKAKDKGVTIEEMLELDAKWVIENEKR